MIAYVIIFENYEHDIEIEKVFLDKEKAYEYFEKLKKERNDVYYKDEDTIIFTNDDAYWIIEKEVEQ